MIWISAGDLFQLIWILILNYTLPLPLFPTKKIIILLDVITLNITNLRDFFFILFFTSTG